MNAPDQQKSAKLSWKLIHTIFLFKQIAAEIAE
jgi:hypothetical protein